MDRSPPTATGRSRRPAGRGRRRRGETVASIARDVGVTTGRVAAATRLYGPFPRGRLTDPSTAAHWAEERRRVPAAEIAHRCQVPISRVYDATRTLGPFPSPLQGAAGTVSLRGISRMSGVSLPALTLRLRRGTLPDPAGHGPRGWPYWNIDDIQDWLAASTLPACPLCRARVQRLDSHLLLSPDPPKSRGIRRVVTHECPCGTGGLDLREFDPTSSEGASDKWCDTKSLVLSGLVDGGRQRWRSPELVFRLVSALTCVAGNGGVRSSGFKPKGARSIRGPQVRRRPMGERN